MEAERCALAGTNSRSTAVCPARESPAAHARAVRQPRKDSRKAMLHYALYGLTFFWPAIVSCAAVTICGLTPIGARPHAWRKIVVVSVSLALLCVVPVLIQHRAELLWRDAIAVLLLVGCTPLIASWE